MTEAEKMHALDLGEGNKKVKCSLDEIDSALNSLSSALMVASEDLVESFKRERSALRRRLCNESNDKSVRTSFIFMTLLKKPATVEFRWSEARSHWNSESNWAGDSAYRRLKVSKSGVPRKSVLLRDAHPEEEALLVRHSQQVVALKESWTRLYKLRAAAKALRRQFIAVGSGGKNA